MADFLQLVDQVQKDLDELRSRLVFMDQVFHGGAPQLPHAPVVELPSVVVPPLVAVAPPSSGGVTATPHPAPIPAAGAEYRRSGLIATCWLNLEDNTTETSGAYDEKFPSGAGKVLREFSVPAVLHDAHSWRMDVTLESTGRTAAGLTPGDVGPWATRDPYWLGDANRRPLAEQYMDLECRWDPITKGWTPTGTERSPKKCNGAGVDLTPAVWSELLGVSVDKIYIQSPSGKISFRLYQIFSSPAPHVVGEIGIAIRAAAVAMVGHPTGPDDPFFSYAPGTEQGNLGCANAVSTILIHAGVLTPAQLELSVEGLSSRLQKMGWWITTGPYMDGDVIIWGPRSGQTHGHVGVLIVDDSGKVIAVNNSSSKRQVTETVLATYDRPVVHVLRAPGA